MKNQLNLTKFYFNCQGGPLIGKHRMDIYWHGLEERLDMVPAV